MQDTERAYRQLARTSASVSVEILRESVSLINFTVPWDTRRTGYMLSTPPESGASKFDAWKGYESGSGSGSGVLPGNAGGDRLHMCVPGLESAPNRQDLPLYLEFVQHHLLLGVDHMFLVNTFGWDSIHMKRFVQMFHSFIDEGTVSVASQAGDGIDNVYSLKGLMLYRDNVKIFYVNMCLYLSKGTADYVAIWDLDEFFIPRRPYNDILEVLRAMEAPGPIPVHSKNQRATDIHASWKGGRGLADGDGHPMCYILLTSQVILSKAGLQQDIWIGEKFSHGAEVESEPLSKQMGFKKSILPTRTIFQAGLHIPGACKLESQWSNCVNKTEQCSYRLVHRFDESVSQKDGKQMIPESEGLIYHYMLRTNRNINEVASKEALQSENEYTTRFYSKVMDHLRERGLELLVALPDTMGPIQTEVSHWKLFNKVYKARHDSSTASSSMNAIAQHHMKYLSLSYSAPIPRIATLPSFVVDESDMALGAVIERVHESWDMYLTTIFLGRSMTGPMHGAYGLERVNPAKLDFWKRIMVKFDKFKLSDIGIREPLVNHYCRISNSAGSRVYTVLGEFIPNRLTPDSNANRRFEIFRCKMQDTERAYRQLARTSASVS
eukprot:gene38993-51282_t